MSFQVKLCMLRPCLPGSAQHLPVNEKQYGFASLTKQSLAPSTSSLTFASLIFPASLLGRSKWMSRLGVLSY